MSLGRKKGECRLPVFKYKAISRDGATVQGVTEAYDEFAAVDKIKETCTIVTAIEEVEAHSGTLSRDLLPARINQKALALLCSQFSTILTAGLPVVRAVELIAKQTSDRTLKKLLETVAADVGDGYGLAQSFENKGAKLLPITFLETLRAGEESGTMEKAFGKLAAYYEEAAKVAAQVRSAMIYPIFLCGLAVAVIAFMLGFTMPVFSEMFEGMDIEMPALTLALMTAADFCKHWWLAIVAVIVGLVLALRLYSTTGSGRMSFARLKLRLPALGRVAQMKGASQLANTMSTMLTAGLPVIRAVSVSAQVLDNALLSQTLAATVPQLETGRRLGDCLKDCRCFPDLLVEMSAVGEETGALEQTLDTVGRYYDGEVAQATKRALAILQPAITVVVGILIGIIVLALYSPIFAMSSGLV